MKETKMVNNEELINYAGLDGLSQHTGIMLLISIIPRYPKPWCLDKEYIFLVADDKTWNTDYIYGQQLQIQNNALKVFSKSSLKTGCKL